MSEKWTLLSDRGAPHTVEGNTLRMHSVYRDISDKKVLCYKEYVMFDRFTTANNVKCWTCKHDLIELFGHVHFAFVSYLYLYQGHVALCKQ